MDETTQRELAELRALLAKYGPASVLSTVGALCANEAKIKTEDEDVELWEVAADAANGAATALLEGGDDEDEESDDEDDAEEGEDDAPEDDASPDEARTDAGEDEEKDASKATEGRRTMTTKDLRLGPRPAKATHWRAFRVEEGTSKWIPLHVDERGDGILTSEWAIRSCTAETIAERWGDGEFVALYISIDGEGKRKPMGRSRTLLVHGGRKPAPSVGTLHNAMTDPPAAQPLPPVVAPSPPPPASALLSPLSPTTAGAGLDPWAMITYLREAEDRAQARATSMAHLEIQRLHAETKDREARWRAEMELQMERERLASKERIAQMELQAKSAGRARGFDPELAAQLGQVLEKVSKVEERVEELADLEDDDDAEELALAPAAAAPLVQMAPPDPLREMWASLAPSIGPIAQALVTKLMEGKGTLAIPDISPPKDPSKKPN